MTLDLWLRDTITAFDANLPIVALAVVGCIAAAGLVSVFRRFNLQRQERLWLEHRLFVPKRAWPIATLPHLFARRERRYYPRRLGNPVSVVLYDDKDTQQIGEGRVVDRSIGGVCVTSATRMPVGTKLQIRPLTQRQLPGVSIEVRSSRPDPVSWRMGCRFLHRPSWSVLMHLR